MIGGGNRDGMELRVRIRVTIILEPITCEEQTSGLGSISRQIRAIECAHGWLSERAQALL